MALQVISRIKTKCPHRNKDIVYDHQMRMIQKCYDCGEETILAHQPTASCSGNHNISIGSYSSGIVNTDKDIKYDTDYSEKYLPRSIIDKNMRFSDTLRADLEKYKRDLAKQQVKQHSKLEILKSKVEQYKKDITNKQNGRVDTEIDRIRGKYDEIMNKQQADNRFSRRISGLGAASAAAISNLDTDEINKFKKAPPQASEYGSNQREYYREEPPQKPLTEYTDIEYVQFLIRNTTFEEKTYEDVKYIDFIFHLPMSQSNSLLDILDSGDVLEWRKIPKNPKLGILSPKIKAIKSIRISVENLKKARKEHTNK